MLFKQIVLQNFRNYSKSSFDFSPQTTLVVGPNTAGKSNLLEAILMLSTGKSGKAEKDIEAIRFGEEMARIKGIGESEIGNGKFELEVIITTGSVQNIETPQKKYLVNNVAKRRVDFAGNLSAVSFSPSDLELIIGSPSRRREFMDDTLEAVDGKYRNCLSNYQKALRQRNALLDLVKETGRRNDKQFEYWDEMVIENGQYITQAREELISFINKTQKDIFECVIFYDHSKISRERLDQYKKAEEGAGVTLVGPHRDDFYVEFFERESQSAKNVKHFGSRGQQRLVVMQLKIIQMDFIQQRRGERPILLLDDIFSELDEGHIHLVLDQIGKQQTIITTTHEELVSATMLKEMQVISLEK